jgi:hypothetical protein
MQTVDIHARDITGEAQRQRRIDRRKLIYRVALATFLLTTMLIWFTI